MIPRYTRSKIAYIWSDENKFKLWLDVEVAVCEAWSKIGRIPEEAVERIKKNANFNVDRILEIEKVTKHDVIAFLENVSEYIGEDAQYLHLGLTSSDILDTAFALQLKQAGEHILNEIDRVLEILKRRAFEFKDTIMIGRTHGIHAEPITFGFKLASWYTEFRRARRRLRSAIETISYGKISGAVGTFANVDPKVEEYALEKLGLRPEPVSTQVVPRDRHAEFFAALALIASSVERVAIEIRHLQRTEVREAEEYFSPGQKGSSAMPHKRNPILSENMTGLARTIRGYLTPALENVALWHERDISHSSVERMIAPDATVLMDFLLHRLGTVLDKLVVYQDQMEKNVYLTRGLIFSQRVMIALMDKGLVRKDAYELVQKHAMNVWNNSTKNLKEELIEDPEIMKYLSKDEIDGLFDVSYYTKNIDYIFSRVFKEIKRRR